jgi:hypothetical protein
VVAILVATPLALQLLATMHQKMTLISMLLFTCPEAIGDSSQTQSFPGDDHAWLFACPASAFAFAATHRVRSFFVQWSAVRSEVSSLEQGTGAEDLF